MMARVQCENFGTINVMRSKYKTSPEDPYRVSLVEREGSIVIFGFGRLGSENGETCVVSNTGPRNHGESSIMILKNRANDRL